MMFDGMIGLGRKFGSDKMDREMWMDVVYPEAIT